MNEENILKNLSSIHRWAEYAPKESHYYLFSCNLLMACHKIEDVYQTMCLARVSLANIKSENFGELIDEHNTFSIAVMKFTFINSAISYYNYCIDLSWQVLWIYFNPENVEHLAHDSRYYEKSTRECTLDGTKYRVTLAYEKKISDFIEKFFLRKETQNIREKYNYIKHRGLYSMKGLWKNHKKSSIGYGGNGGTRLNLIHRRELDVEKLIEELIEFDKVFVAYFEMIIEYIVPNNFLNKQEITSNDIATYLKSLKEYGYIK